jgi:hypothetical protein
MTLTFRRDLSRNLTAAEGDGNIDDLNGRVITLEGTLASGGISSITISGTVITFHFSDSSTQSVDIGTANAYSLSDHVKGVWQPSISYAKDDIFTYQGSLYVVAIAHTSPSVFDENYTSGGLPVYKVIARYNQGVLTVSTTGYIPAVDAANKYIRCTNASGCTIQLNPNVFAPADYMTFRQCGAGGLTFDWPTSVTVNMLNGYNPTTSVQGSVVNVFVVGAAEYDLFGFVDLA